MEKIPDCFVSLVVDCTTHKHTDQQHLNDCIGWLVDNFNLLSIDQQKYISSILSEIMVFDRIGEPILIHSFMAEAERKLWGKLYRKLNPCSISAFYPI